MLREFASGMDIYLRNTEHTVVQTYQQLVSVVDTNKIVRNTYTFSVGRELQPKHT